MRLGKRKIELQQKRTMLFTWMEDLANAHMNTMQMCTNKKIKDTLNISVSITSITEPNKFYPCKLSIQTSHKHPINKGWKSTYVSNVTLDNDCTINLTRLYDTIEDVNDHFVTLYDAYYKE